MSVAAINPSGVSTAFIYRRDTGSGLGPGRFVDADPGNVNPPIIFEPDCDLTGDKLEVWIIVSGASVNWGGAEVWGSTDPAGNFGVLGTASGSPQGVLSANFASGSDPDTSHTLSVDLTESRGTITPGTRADADAHLTLCYCGGELIAYSAATLTSLYHYRLDTYMRRGLYKTAIISHAAGSAFARITPAVFRFGYPKSLIGTTIDFKFTSFNGLGTREQDLANVAAYSYKLTGAGICALPDCPVDIVLSGGASEDWGSLGECVASTCDWGLLGTPETQCIDMGGIFQHCCFPLCDTPPTNGQLLAWDAAQNKWCPFTLPPPPIVLCDTPPTDGQILVFNEINNDWCPADLCPLVAACLLPAPYQPPAIYQGTLEGPVGTDIKSTGTTPADSTTLLIATWFLGVFPYPGGGNNAMNFLNSLAGIDMQLSSSGPASNFTAVDAGNALVVTQNDMSGDTGTSAIANAFDSNWHSFAMSINTATHTFQLLVDRVFYDLSATPNTSWFSTNAISYGGLFTFDIDGSNALSNFFVQTGAAFFDLSVGSNQDKLFAPGNHPVDWGPTGSLVTGTQPQIFLTGDHTSFNNNAGSGGAFIVDIVPLSDWIPGPT